MSKFNSSLNALEKEILTRSIDLSTSMSNQNPVNFHSILLSFESVCSELKVNKQTERKCYQVLVLMSADIKRTWWEKATLLDSYVMQKSSSKNLLRSSNGSKSAKNRNTIEKSIRRSQSMDPGAIGDRLRNRKLQFGEEDDANLMETDDLSLLLNTGNGSHLRRSNLNSSTPKNVAFESEVRSTPAGSPVHDPYYAQMTIRSPSPTHIHAPSAAQLSPDFVQQTLEMQLSDLVSSPELLSRSTNGGTLIPPKGTNDMLTADDSSINDDRDIEEVATITCSVKILFLFQKWLMGKSTEKVTVMLKNLSPPAMSWNLHLSELSNFVSPLYGQEQWLRDKIRELTISQVYRVVFRMWSYTSGVVVVAREHGIKHALQRGFQKWIEFVLFRVHIRKGGSFTSSNSSSSRRTTQQSVREKLLRDTGMRDTGKQSRMRSSEFNTSRLYSNSPGSSTPSSISRSSISNSHFSTARRPSMQSVSTEYGLFSSSINSIKDKSSMRSHGGRSLQDTSYFWAKGSKEYNYWMLSVVRRLYSRTVTRSKYDQVRDVRRKGLVKRTFTVWFGAHTAVCVSEAKLNREIERTQRKICCLKVMNAFHFLRKNVNLEIMRREKEGKQVEKIKNNCVCRRAIYTFYCAAVAKCFYGLERNYAANAPSVKEYMKSKRVFAENGLKRGCALWRKYMTRLSEVREAELNTLSSGIDDNNEGTAYYSGASQYRKPMKELNRDLANVRNLILLRRSLHKLFTNTTYYRLYFYASDIQRSNMSSAVGKESRSRAILARECGSCRLRSTSDFALAISRLHSSMRISKPQYGLLSSNSKMELPDKILCVLLDMKRCHFTVKGGTTLEHFITASSGPSASVYKIYSPISLAEYDTGAVSTVGFLLLVRLKRFIKCCRKLVLLRKKFHAVKKKTVKKLCGAIWQFWRSSYRDMTRCSYVLKSRYMLKFRDMHDVRKKIILRANRRCMQYLYRKHFRAFRKRVKFMKESVKKHISRFVHQLANPHKSKDNSSTILFYSIKKVFPPSWDRRDIVNRIVRHCVLWNTKATVLRWFMRWSRMASQRSHSKTVVAYCYRQKMINYLQWWAHVAALNKKCSRYLVKTIKQTFMKWRILTVKEWSRRSVLRSAWAKMRVMYGFNLAARVWMRPVISRMQSAIDVWRRWTDECRDAESVLTTLTCNRLLSHSFNMWLYWLRACDHFNLALGWQVINQFKKRAFMGKIAKANAKMSVFLRYNIKNGRSRERRERCSAVEKQGDFHWSRVLYRKAVALFRYKINYREWQSNWSSKGLVQNNRHMTRRALRLLKELVRQKKQFNHVLCYSSLKFWQKRQKAVTAEQNMYALAEQFHNQRLQSRGVLQWKSVSVTNKINRSHLQVAEKYRAQSSVIFALTLFRAYTVSDGFTDDNREKEDDESNTSLRTNIMYTY